MSFQVIIHDAEEGGYWAEVTGMPGCYSQGETIAEVKTNIHEAALAWMESQLAMAVRKADGDRSATTARHVRKPRRVKSPCAAS